jgi:hypothetical protein
VIVDFSVENQPNAIGATTHGLVAGGRQIDNRKPAKAKTATGFVKDQISGIVGPAMRHHVAHPFDQGTLDSALRRAIFPDSADATHSLFAIADCDVRST